MSACAGRTKAGAVCPWPAAYDAPGDPGARLCVMHAASAGDPDAKAAAAARLSGKANPRPKPRPLPRDPAAALQERVRRLEELAALAEGRRDYATGARYREQALQLILPGVRARAESPPPAAVVAPPPQPVQINLRRLSDAALEALDLVVDEVAGLAAEEAARLGAPADPVTREDVLTAIAPGLRFTGVVERVTTPPAGLCDGAVVLPPMNPEQINEEVKCE